MNSNSVEFEKYERREPDIDAIAEAYQDRKENGELFKMEEQNDEWVKDAQIF